MTPSDPIVGLDDLVVSEADELRAVMDRMTRNRLGFVLVCSPGRHLLGVVADGDLRRALVDGTLLSAPVAKVLNADPVTATDDAAALAAVVAGGLVAVPVVDPTNAVVALALGGPEPRLLHQSSGARRATEGPAAVRTMALVPARGGSRRLPGKNLALLHGTSLVARAVAAGVAAPGVDLVVCSTDDEAIASEARAAGAAVPWLRPADLATDEATTASVVAHALAWAVEHLDPVPEVLVLLEPTAPLRPLGLIDGVLDALAADPEAACALTVAEVPHTLHPDEQLTLDGDALVPAAGGALRDRRLRGEQEPTFIATGQVYAVRVERASGGEGVLLEPARAVVRPWGEVLDIDDAEDLRRAEAVWSARGAARR